MRNDLSREKRIERMVTISAGKGGAPGANRCDCCRQKLRGYRVKATWAHGDVSYLCHVCGSLLAAVKLHELTPEEVERTPFEVFADRWRAAAESMAAAAGAPVAKEVVS